MNLFLLCACSNNPRPMQWNRHHAQACAKCRATIVGVESWGSIEKIMGYAMMRSNI